MVELAELGWGRDDPAFRHVFSLQFDARRHTRAVGRVRRAAAAHRDAGERGADHGGHREPRRRLTRTTRAGAELVIHARGDRRAPLDEGRSLATLIPDSRLVVLDSSNHILLHDEPAWARFLVELNRFLEE